MKSNYIPNRWLIYYLTGFLALYYIVEAGGV